ncbi:hypothetical protein MHI59_29150 [Bacillus sp. FSL K6-2822]|uniref:hypothetical protein n=1 Tax=Bacillus sp. FSL K6-2822 TaxID=2921478 RepID=UPI0030F91BF7
MFENMLLKFYKKRMTIWSFVFKPVLKRFICYVLTQVLALIVMIIVSAYYTDKSGGRDYWFTGCFLGFEVFLFFTFGFLIFKPAKIKLFNKYQIELYGEEWEPFRYLLLKKFLIKEKIMNGLDGKNSKNKDEISLDFCIERLEKRLERRKKDRIFTILSSYIAIFVALVVPVWAAFNNWLYMKSENVTLGSAAGYLAIVIVIIISVFAFFILVRHFFIEDLLQLGDQRISQLIDMLQVIKFSLNHSNYLGPFEKKNHINESIIKVLDEYELDKLKEKKKKKSAWWNFSNIDKSVIMSKKMNRYIE